MNLELGANGNKDNQWGLHDFEKYTYTDTKDIKTYINCLLNENKITFFSVFFLPNWVLLRKIY
jgi:hypothetical protein